jgi:hydrogenase maturation protein HypF
MEDQANQVAAGVAPGNPYLGIMLPYTPLHHLLMADLDFPVVATSGNRSDEPICTSEPEALECLADIADLFLVHNRPIARHVDDSILRLMGGREVMLRRSRGYAPLPILLSDSGPPLLGVGAHLKNSIALSVGQQVFISQHIGDLDNASAFGAFQQVVADFTRMYDTHPTQVATDLHPDYLSSQFAERMGLPLFRVQHHQAHVLAVMAEQQLQGPVLGVAWDGSGYGLDGTIWGGEFFTIKDTSITHLAHLRPFRLPGGDKAAGEPRRSALGLLYEIFSNELFNLQDLAPVDAFNASEQDILRTMLTQGLNSPRTSSAGRLFDAVAALIGLRQESNFEGQAAMELEFALEGVETDEVYHFTIMAQQTPYLIDWEPMVRGLLREWRDGVAVGTMAAKFHNTLAAVIVSIAKLARLDQVVLSGGCFQNKYLTERTISGLSQAGFQPYWAHLVPPNDGGIALGQVLAATLQSSILDN